MLIEKRKWDGSVTARWEADLRQDDGWIVTAVVGGDGALVRYKVDATVGDEERRQDVFVFVDIDLDLEIADGEARVEDLAEFAERRRTMGYPPGLLSHALAALDDALARYRRAAWPFDGSLLAEARLPS